MDLTTNKKAYFDYEILESYEAGIALTGTEVKSLRDHGGSLQESYILIREGELWLLHSYIAPYKFGNIYNHEERRERKLLMHRQEIMRLKKSVAEKGLALVPLSLYLKKGKVKVKIGLVRGKKKHDKREKIKSRDARKRIKDEG